MPAEVFYLQLLILCCLLKLGSTIFFLISLFFFYLHHSSQGPWCCCPHFPVHSTELQAHAERRSAPGCQPGGPQSRARGQGSVWCCMAAGTPGSRAEHLGPMDAQRPRESGGSPKGIQRVKLSNVLAQQLHGAHLSHPRTLLKALC